MVTPCPIQRLGVELGHNASVPQPRALLLLLAAACLVPPAGEGRARADGGTPPGSSAVHRLDERALRRGLRALLEREPLTIHRREIPRAPSARSQAPSPGGPSFVLATDDGTLQHLDWTDVAQARSGVQRIEALYHGLAADDVRFIIAFTTWIDWSFGAFYTPLANDVRGIGYEWDGPREVYDTTGDSPLEGVLHMNGLTTFGTGPQADWTFNHELAHRWGALVRYDDGSSGPSDALLGRQLVHWSWFLATGGSPLEGNPWVDAGQGRFVATPLGAQAALYSPLDLYLMGLVPPSEVPPTFLVVPDPATPLLDDQGQPVTPGSTPQTYGAARSIHGTRREVTLDQVLAVEGPRVPTSDEAPRAFEVGFLLVVRPGEERAQSLLDRMEQRVERAVAGFATATGGRGRLLVESHGVSPNGPAVADGGDAMDGGDAGRSEAMADAMPSDGATAMIKDGGDGGKHAGGGCAVGGTAHASSGAQAGGAPCAGLAAVLTGGLIALWRRRFARRMGSSRLSLFSPLHGDDKQAK